ncbi:hypothetical protein RHGRI_006889 [Rhododendron griersonianum]|uniref:Uncharacterized protein n=1 Tax=Rhododendron griersonianum TaxID=479676 RepID=A0AAV6KVJ0_9ERIC|nr:hypothetical protein RHGRI_006889 [Rhododendron griersonianum]
MSYPQTQARSRAKSLARSKSPMLWRSSKQQQSHVASVDSSSIERRGIVGETLTPLMEGPDPDSTRFRDSKRHGLGQ